MVFGGFPRGMEAFWGHGTDIGPRRRKTRGKYMAAVLAVALWLMIISILDIRTRKIPIWLLIAGGVCVTPALAAQWSRGVGGCVDILKGMLPGVLLLGMGLGTKKVGYGDGVVMLFLGMALGGGKSWMLLGISLFLTAGVSLVLLALSMAGGKTTIPYLPFLTAAWILTIIG